MGTAVSRVRVQETPGTTIARACRYIIGLIVPLATGKLSVLQAYVSDVTRMRPLLSERETGMKVLAGEASGHPPTRAAGVGIGGWGWGGGLGWGEWGGRGRGAGGGGGRGGWGASSHPPGQRECGRWSEGGVRAGVGEGERGWGLGRVRGGGWGGGGASRHPPEQSGAGGGGGGGGGEGGRHRAIHPSSAG